ncbi:hypothetical protein AYI68_g3948 [Smittium mucronatum]|uniref:Uncharacterized protein n=1 Tax=Smittium mucronatum TaxID=133383 RepID=A0A1R0GYM2_9FUNG|nr:hypothetical protein AYI68_g3948 [Smittium mucronatum]
MFRTLLTNGHPPLNTKATHASVELKVPFGGSQANESPGMDSPINKRPRINNEFRKAIYEKINSTYYKGGIATLLEKRTKKRLEFSLNRFSNFRKKHNP